MGKQRVQSVIRILDVVENVYTLLVNVYKRTLHENSPLVVTIRCQGAIACNRLGATYPPWFVDVSLPSCVGAKTSLERNVGTILLVTGGSTISSSGCIAAGTLEVSMFRRV